MHDPRKESLACKAMAATRLLELLFAFYFFTHIPITLFIDLQALLPGFYPKELTEWSAWYTSAFKDPMMADPPVWFRSFIYSEAFFQLPFFPVAAYAFWKGNCKWIRTPAIIYATHVATTLLPILAHILFSDFSKSQHPGPQTHHERLTLVAIYIPYLLIPLLILVSMLLSPSYNQVEKRKKK
ncbi:sigma intracellular receptor 2 [Sceloporus undulatus]|uniref:sigma intracellular receptor 2 n=1 Tax=Sceloporus undulatus TaxID=8520 RepID=UPI001C4A91BE|nr:sigma intracellular receptor 2 [Sceloporus undulatus]